jgi:predicted anti-sigma-YlaC factor YlaD
MYPPALPKGCQQAREAVSLKLDGELSELGSTRLAKHLRRCEACSAYATELEAIADQLRSAPLEQPARQVLVHRSVSALRIATVAAGAAAVVSGLALTVGSLLNGPRAGSTESTLSAPALSLGPDVQILRQLSPLGVAERERSNRAGPTQI